MNEDLSGTSLEFPEGGDGSVQPNLWCVVFGACSSSSCFFGACPGTTCSIPCTTPCLSQGNTCRGACDGSSPNFTD